MTERLRRVPALAAMLLLLTAGHPAHAPSVTYIANEGVMIAAPGTKVLIDALFGDGLPEYGAASPATRNALESGRAPFDGVDLVLATHIHRDHFDPGAVLRHLAANPRATFVSTAAAVARMRETDSAAVRGLGARIVGVDVSDGERRLVARAGGARVFALGMPHGRRPDLPVNLGFLVEVVGCRFLHIGDTTIGPEELGRFGLAQPGIDVALLPDWYLLTPDLREAVRESVRPRHVVALHLPAEPRAHLAALRTEFPDAHTFDRELAVWRVPRCGLRP
jgi:L-ascorbate metabolism protein UlaG (beta-lactamase superfamily)